MEKLRTLLSKTLVALSLASLISAVPNVTVVPLGSGCASYPGYDDASGIAGPLRVTVDSTGKEFDGFQFGPQFSTAVGGGAWGFVRAYPPSSPP